jgi:hypothetical protein
MKAANAALAVLHRLRGTSTCYRALLDVAYNAEFLLPSPVNKALQSLLQRWVQDDPRRMTNVHRRDIRCSGLLTQGKRSLLL